MVEERIIIKISQLENYIKELESVLPEKIEDFYNSIITKRAVERILQISIECVIDICAILVKELKLGPPTSEDGILELLENEIQSTNKISQMKGFRNILVHKYGNIEDNKVYSFANENKNDFTEFIQEIKSLIKEL